MSRSGGYKCYNIRCGSCIGKTLCGEPGDGALECDDRMCKKSATDYKALLSEREGDGDAGGDGMSLIDLYVRDKSTGKIHKVGSDIHDGLWVDSNGTVHYQNLQNGDGCNANSHNDKFAGYEFMPSDFGELEAHQ